MSAKSFSLDHITKRATMAFKNSPVEMTLALFAMILGLHSVYMGKPQDIMLRMMPNLALGIVISYGITILHHFKVLDGKTRWAMNGAFLMALGAFTTFIFDPDTQSSWWTWGSIFAASTLGFTLLPLTRTQDSMGRRRWFWNFNALFAVRLLLSGCFLTALYMGLGLAFAAVNQLLKFGLSGDLMASLAIVLWTFVFPWMVVSGLPQLKQASDIIDTSTRRLISFACHGLFLPLMLLYMAILYTYNLKILVAGLDQAPKNIMSPVILVAAGLQLASMFFGEQLRHGKDGAKRWFVRIIETLPPLFLPLFPLAIWAVWVRIEQYGWTEFRYLRMLVLVVLIIIFAVATVQRIRKQPQPLAAMFAIMSGAILLSTIGPWSAHDVTWRSQMTRFKTQMKQQGLLDSTAKDSSLINQPLVRKPKQIHYDNRSQLLTLCKKFGHQKLRAHFEYIPSYTHIDSCKGLLDKAGFGYGQKTTSTTKHITIKQKMHDPAPLQHTVMMPEGYLYVRKESGQERFNKNFGVMVRYTKNTKRLALFIHDLEIAHTDLTTLLDAAKTCDETCIKTQATAPTLDVHRAIHDKNDKLVGFISIHNMTLKRRHSGEFELENIHFNLTLDRSLMRYDGKVSDTTPSNRRR